MNLEHRLAKLYRSELSEAGTGEIDRIEADQRTQFRTGRVPVAVYGLGKMGLPLAAVYGDVSGNVVGVDVDEARVGQINGGECPVEREPGLPELVARLVEDGALRATTDGEAAARDASIHVVIVPTLIDSENHADLSLLRDVIETVGQGLTPGDLVVVESTVPPGTCRDVVVPLLESVSGHRLGEFGVAFCPERTSSGRAIEDIRGAYPKVVGGVDAESTRVAALVYGEINENEVIAVSDVTVAECVKVFEGIYRDVNIALANELATFADELDVNVNEAIRVANTQPYCNIHTPGIGVGGHCIPYYPYFLVSGRETDAPLVRTARTVNDRMPAFAVDRLADGFEAAGRALAGSTVLVLGATYRPGIDEIRKSPAIDVIDELNARGATVLAVDPVLSDRSVFDARFVDLANLEAESFDGVVLVTPHEEFERIDWAAFDDLVVVDGRSALALDATSHRVYTVGGS